MNIKHLFFTTSDLFFYYSVSLALLGLYSLFKNTLSSYQDDFLRLSLREKAGELILMLGSFL